MATIFAVELLGDLSVDARRALDDANIEVSGASHGGPSSGPELPQANHRYVRVEAENSDEAKAAVEAVVAEIEGVYIGPHDVKPAP